MLISFNSHYNQIIFIIILTIMSIITMVIIFINISLYYHIISSLYHKDSRCLNHGCDLTSEKIYFKIAEVF